MAWKQVKEDNGKYAIVIDGFDKGTAPDPYSGMGRMLNVNLNVLGEVSVGYGLTANATSGGTLGKPIADSTRLFAYGTPGVPVGSPQSFAILDANGRVWESTSITGTFAFLSSSNSTTNSGTTDGVCYWMGYLWKTRGAAVDYWTGSTWTTGWAGLTLTAGVKHDMYVATDNVMYITNGNYLASVAAPTPTSFDPTNSATYSASATKLLLPVTDIALSIAEVGGGNTPASTLLIGGTQNLIYPWDKISSSFSLPIVVGDSYIAKMVSVNQSAFIFPGNQQGRGRIYITNGSQADLYFKMPDYVFGEQDPYYVFGDANFHRNNLLFGCFVTKNSGSGTLLVAEVFAIDLDTKVFRGISDIPANATGQANATCLISTGNLSAPGMGYIVAWDDNGSAPGIGYSGTTAGIGTSSVITDLIPVGTFLAQKTQAQVEYKLRTPMQSGESITITPIIDGVSGTVLTFSPTAGSGQLSGVATVNFQNAQWLQFQIAQTGNSATSGVRLKEIRIR